MQLRTLATLAIVSVLALAGCGGGSSPEGMAKRQTSITQDLGAALAKITDKASAEKQKPAVEAAITQMKALMKEMKSLPADQQKASEELAKNPPPELEAAVAKVAQETMRINSIPEALGVLQAVLAKMMSE